MTSKRPTTKRKSNQFRPTLLLPPAETDEPKYTTKSGRFIVDDITKIGPKGMGTPMSPPKQQQRTGQPTSEERTVAEGTPIIEITDERLQHQQQQQNNDNETNHNHNNSIDFDHLDISSKTLGSGASANVRKCKNVHTNETYALKEIILDRNSEEKMHRIIVAEFKALQECQTSPNTNIIRMYDAYHRQGKLYMLLEYMDCGSLSDLMRYCGSIPERILSGIAEQILKGLLHLHVHKSIIHRDIKPENLLINSKGEVKLADFGMAGLGSKECCRVFKTFLGTCLFMSPERIKGEEHGFDSDIWSLGLSLAQLALGHNPIEQKAYWDLVLEHKQNELDNNADLDASLKIDYSAMSISDNFKDFLQLCLRMNPSQRPTAYHLLDHPFIVSPSTTVEETGDGKKKRKKPKTATSVVRRWLYDCYIPKRKEMERQKLRAKQQT